MFSQKAKNIPPFYVMEVHERALELERSGRNIIHMEVGEPDFPTAPHINQAAIDALKSGETKYTHSLGLPQLREAVATSYNNKFNLKLSPEQVIINSGTSPAMLVLFMGLLDQGHEVIMSNPYYAAYPNFVEYMNGKPVFVYTKEEEGFSLDPESVAREITPRTRAIIINSPSNPTGHVMQPETLTSVSEVAGDIPIISDEIYQGLVYKGEDHSILEYTDNAFVLNGFSKLYAMTGWRLGYLIAPPEYIRTLQKIQQNFFICANSFVQHAGVAALEGPQDHVKEMVSTYDKRRRFILDRLKDIGFGINSEPEGAYYVLANAKEFSGDSLELSRSILEEAGVAVTPGIDFGKGAEGYIRFSYANNLANIKEGMDRIDNYLNN
ncbi:MAG: pyridoxal phosphate-dependent aminotransferase [ANME-2 cluster archaeon]|nr:MAG: pyridoxal phosphate-dependent aminotransferase [ANME-2 cluster archaeon]